MKCRNSDFLLTRSQNYQWHSLTVHLLLCFEHSVMIMKTKTLINPKCKNELRAKTWCGVDWCLEVNFIHWLLTDGLTQNCFNDPLHQSCTPRKMIEIRRNQLPLIWSIDPITRNFNNRKSRIAILLQLPTSRTWGM